MGAVDEMSLEHYPGMTEAERKHRRDNEHLDASAGVEGIEEFYRQCVADGATVIKPLAPPPAATGSTMSIRWWCTRAR